MNRFISRRPFALVFFAVIGTLALAAPAQAAKRAYASRGSAQFTNETEFVGVGNATHLGRYTEEGSVLFTPTDDGVEVHASTVYTAANGDKLHAVITGLLNPETGAITATVTFVGGTGRFANASGTATLTGQLLPGGVVEVSTNGTINY